MKKLQLQCKDITIAYDRVNIMEKVNVDIYEGDYISIVGENGTGKSSLIKGILGLVPIKSGEILYGENISRKSIGYLPQQTAAQNDFPASVREIVLSGSLNSKRFSPFYSYESKEKAKKVMKRLGIADMAGKTYGSLSGGQKQRVLLARALLATGEILFMDEPISGLDPIVTAEFYEIVADLNKRDNMTIVMVSHDIDNAMKYSDKILHMGEKEYYYGTKEEYRTSVMAKGFVKNDVSGEIAPNTEEM